MLGWLKNWLASPHHSLESNIASWAKAKNNARDVPCNPLSVVIYAGNATDAATQVLEAAAQQAERLKRGDLGMVQVTVPRGVSIAHLTKLVERYANEFGLQLSGYENSNFAFTKL
ncbi:hypothetical protein FJZ39_01325 [Candidatus Saccharibacteria bacterium]|nr:hypothetical protein [Candidatus Saccharibacteria bacterium]